MASSDGSNVFGLSRKVNSFCYSYGARTVSVYDKWMVTSYVNSSLTESNGYLIKHSYLIIDDIWVIA